VKISQPMVYKKKVRMRLQDRSGNCTTYLILWSLLHSHSHHITYLILLSLLHSYSHHTTYLTLELRMSHICDARGRALSAAVAFWRQSSRVALSARGQAA